MKFEKLYILSGTYEEAVTFAVDNNIPLSICWFISDYTALRGIKNVRVIRLGTWRNRADLDVIENMILLSKKP